MLDVIEDKEKFLNFLRMEKWIFDSPGQAGECLQAVPQGLLPGQQARQGGTEARRQGR